MSILNSEKSDFEVVRNLLEVEEDPRVEEEHRERIAEEFAEAVVRIGEEWNVDVTENMHKMSPEIKFSSERTRISAGEIYLLYPEIFYKDVIENSSSQEVIDKIESDYFPVPITWIAEEAGHYVSDLAIGRVRTMEGTYENFVVNELFGALALGMQDSVFLQDQIVRLERNLDVIKRMYSKEHSEFIDSLDLDNELDNILSAIYQTKNRREDIEQLEGVLSKRRNTLLQEAPALSNDKNFADYSRPRVFQPPTYSEWFVNQAFNFIEPLSKYLRDPPSMTADEALSESQSRVEKRMSELSELEDLNKRRAEILLRASEQDRAYLNSRIWARDILSEENSKLVSQMVYQPTPTLVEEYERRIHSQDANIIEDYDLNLSYQMNLSRFADA